VAVARGEHRVPPVHGEVQQHLLELTGIGAHRRVVEDADVEDDLLAERAPEQRLGVAHERRQADRLQAHGCLRLKARSCRTSVACPLGGAADLGEVLPHGIVGGEGGREVAARELEVGADDRQQVVEVVRDAAASCPHRLHLLRLRSRASSARCSVTSSVSPAMRVTRSSRSRTGNMRVRTIRSASPGRGGVLHHPRRPLHHRVRGLDHARPVVGVDLVEPQAGAAWISSSDRPVMRTYAGYM
jgi:hypothetical protein